MECVYCKRKIESESKEHIIHNALGGHLTFSEICCPKCNNIIQKLIDDKFTSIFEPITGRISNLKKTSNTKSKPSYLGYARFKEKIYDVYLKDGKVVSCKKLCKEIKSNLTEEIANEFEVLGYYFDIDNLAFKNGMAKIAFNFALMNGISIEYLEPGINLKVSDKELEKVDFKYSVFPFVPINKFDWFIETSLDIDLYHNLILFNSGSKLWCYIDLFNTFQFYVLLSDDWNENEIYEVYTQKIEHMERNIPEIRVRKPKQIKTYSDMYGVEPTMDIDELQKRIKNKISKASYERSIEEILSIKSNYFEQIMEETNVKDKLEYIYSYNFYFDQNDKLREKTFRRFTPIPDINQSVYTSYPLYILNSLSEIVGITKEYTRMKIHNLNKYLCFKDEN